MRATCLTALLALLLAGCGASVEASSDGAISPEELAHRIESGSAPVVLDVRSRDEFAGGHIPGAINIPYDEIDARRSEIPASASDEIVVLCQSGGRARIAEQTLREQGHDNVRDLTGHWKEWRARGLPTR
jgi:rhodanese-related sulfurtransferase